LTITGVTRLLRAPVSNSRDLRSDQRHIASAIGYRYDDYEAFYNEAAAFVTAGRSRTFVPLPQPPVPAVVLTSELNANDPNTGTIWRQLQDEIASAYPNTTHTVVKSGHFIQVEQPRTVIDAITAIVNQAGRAVPVG
jgi:pimeloyl-ACP methyl ester carboxylesterase